MKIPLNEISTPGLLKLLRDVAAELDSRLNAEPPLKEVQDMLPVVAIRVPPEDEADFALMIAAKLRAGEYIRANERQRIAEIAQEYAPWISRQGLPTTHNAGDWQRKGRDAGAPRAKMR